RGHPACLPRAAGDSRLPRLSRHGSGLLQEHLHQRPGWAHCRAGDSGTGIPRRRKQRRAGQSPAATTLAGGAARGDRTWTQVARRPPGGQRLRGVALMAALPDLLTAGVPLQEAQAAMILVHGRGATAASILMLAEELDRDGFAYLAPQAPGQTWYPYSFLAPLE